MIRSVFTMVAAAAEPEAPMDLGVLYLLQNRRLDGLCTESDSDSISQLSAPEEYDVYSLAF